MKKLVMMLALVAAVISANPTFHVRTRFQLSPKE